jgi:hypothetical protein
MGGLDNEAASAVRPDFASEARERNTKGKGVGTMRIYNRG